MLITNSSSYVLPASHSAPADRVRRSINQETPAWDYKMIYLEFTFIRKPSKYATILFRNGTHDRPSLEVPE